jgi:large subunit ribosomal protein L10
MPNQKNIDQLKKIKEKLDTVSSMILVNYTGVPVADQQALRNDLTENEGSFAVTKNTLISLALSKRSPEVLEQLKDSLEGPTAVIYAQDVVSAAKTLTDFTKDHPTFAIKAGVSLSPDQDRILTAEEIEKLSKLPTKDQLYAQLLSQLNAPIQSLVRVIGAPLQNLSYVLQNHVERG